MTGFNHILTGVAIATTVKHPVLAPLLAFASHFVLDALPHYDPGYYGPHQPRSKQFKPYVILEAIVIPLALGFSIFLFQTEWWLVLLCAFAAYAPDILWLAEKNHGHRHGFRHFYWFHTVIQWCERRWGWTIEVSYFALLLVFLTAWSPVA